MQEIKVLITCHHEMKMHTSVPSIMRDIYDSLQKCDNYKVQLVSHDNLKFIPSKMKIVVFPFYVFFTIVLARWKGRKYNIVWSTSGDLIMPKFIKIICGKPKFVFHSHNIEQVADTQLEINGMNFSLKRKIFRYLCIYPSVRQSIRVSDLLFVYSDDEVRFVNKYNSNSKIIKIKNYSRLLFGTSTLLNNSKNIVFVGRGTQAKGFDVVLDAMTLMLKTDNEVCFYLLGTGDLGIYTQSLNFLYEKYPQRIFVVNQYENNYLEKILPKCKVFFFPTRSEGYSVALVEALQFGLISVISGIPIHKEIKREIPEIELVDDYNHLEYVRSLKKALGQPDVIREGISNKVQELNKENSINFWISCLDYV